MHINGSTLEHINFRRVKGKNDGNLFLLGSLCEGEASFITSFSHDSFSLKIPESIHTVTNSLFDYFYTGETEYAMKMFSDCCVSVSLPKKLNKIGDAAFRNFSKLESIIITENVSEIGRNAFPGKIKSENVVFESDRFFKIEEGVLFGENGSLLHTFFPSDEKTSYTVPNCVTKVGSCAFKDCVNLVELNIGKNVKRIGKYAFADCSNLKTINFPEHLTRDIDSSGWQYQAEYNEKMFFEKFDRENPKLSLEQPIENLKLSFCLYNRLKRARINTVSGLLMLSDETYQLENIRNLSEECREELECKIEEIKTFLGEKYP